MDKNKKAFLVIGGVSISGGMILMLLLIVGIIAIGRSKMPAFDLDHIEGPAGNSWLENSALAIKVSMTDYEFTDIGIAKIARPKNAKPGDLEFHVGLFGETWKPRRIDR